MNTSRTNDATATKPLTTVTSDAPPEVKMVAVRRRRRRRTSPQDKRANQIRFALLGVILVLIGVAAGGKTLQMHIGQVVKGTLMYTLAKFGGRMEIIALIIAALAIVYLMPGVENKVLRTLGIRKRK